MATGSTQFHSTREPGTLAAIDSDGTRVTRAPRRATRAAMALTPTGSWCRCTTRWPSPAVAKAGTRPLHQRMPAALVARHARSSRDVVPAAGRQVGRREAGGAGRLGDALAPAAGRHDLHVVAQGAQRLGERQQHDLAAADLAVVGGQHDRGHDRPATAR